VLTFIVEVYSAVLGQAAAQSPPAADALLSVQVQSILDFVIKGGPIMIPIGLCSLVALAVIVERLVSLRRSRVIPSGFLPGLKVALGDGQEDRPKALEYCKSNGSPLANILAAGIKKLGHSEDVLERHIDDAGQREVFKLRKYLRLLSVIGSIAPLLGLLGTIFGMITAFQTVAATAEALGRTELLAKGIYEAMITTAGGLIVAIPVWVAYHYLSARIDRFVGEMDQLTVDFIEEYAEHRPDAEAAMDMTTDLPFGRSATATVAT